MTAADAVTVAYLHDNLDAHCWHQSLIELIGWDLAHEGRIVRGGWQSMKPGTGGLVEGRNEVVASFLADDRADWLWWVDTDMGFAPDTADRLLAAADPAERPIVGGLCFAWRELGPDGMGGFHAAPRPTIFDWLPDNDPPGFVGRTRYPVNALVQCAGTGAACVLIHRSVLDRIGETFGTWYDRVPGHDGKLISEDLSFCVRAAAVEAPVFVHTGVRTTHQKTIWVGERDYWTHALAPPANERVAVIVPVLERPQNAEPFMRSLRASTGLATCYAICETVDHPSQSAWMKAGAEVIVGDAHTFAEKVNVGVSVSAKFAPPHPWLFLTGDDVRFHPGWLDHAQAIAGDTHHVVGTNDMGNPRVIAGEHATHLLVRRSYVTEVGASWDGPGVACHEGYRHWFVDDEVVTAAKQRNVWAMALGSRVEHLHPAWGKAEMDDVYELGQKAADEDGRLFRRRLRESISRAAVPA